MGNLFDILLILTVLITVIITYRLGFIRLLKPYRVIAAFIIAWRAKSSEFMRGIVTRIVDPADLKEHIKAQVDYQWSDKISDAAGATVESEATRFDGVFGAFGRIFDDVVAYCRTTFEKGVQDFTDKVVDFAANIAVEFFVSAIGFLIAFIFLSLAFLLGSVILNWIFSRGVLGVINRSIGGICGLFFGMLIAWIASLLIVHFGSLLVTGGIEETVGGFLRTVKWFHNNFILSKIFGVQPI